MRSLDMSQKPVVLEMRGSARCRIAPSKSDGNALCTRAYGVPVKPVSNCIP